MEDDIQHHLQAQRYGEAFELLLEHFREKVFRLAFSLLRNETAAEDAAQDVFLKIWRALPAHQGGGAVSSWIYTITRNTCLTELKKRALRPTVSLQAPELAATADSIPALQSPTAALGSEMDVDRMLADLPEKYRRVLILFYMEQRAYDEVACMLGLPLGTVKTLLFRAKKLLLQQGLRDSPGPRNTVRPPQNQSPPRPETSAPPMNIRPEPLLSVL